MHQGERQPRYMGSFVDFWVRIREFTGEMQLILLCFAVLTHIVLFLGLRHFTVQFDLFQGCRTQWGPANVLNPSPSAISILSTPRAFLEDSFHL